VAARTNKVLIPVPLFIVACFIVHTSLPAYSGEVEQVEQQVNMLGVYQLEQVENYEEYLLAMKIPAAAVKHIQMMKWDKQAGAELCQAQSVLAS
jgi:hypothetical protein